MLAAASATGRTRLQRAKAAAISLRANLPDIATGVGTATDRVLPNLLPSADGSAFERTVATAIDSEQPPPIEDRARVTTLSPLAEVARNGTFAPSAKQRVLIVLTDGESRPFDLVELSRVLARRPATALVLIHVWRGSEAVFDPTGAREGAYRPDRTARSQLDALARATGGSVFAEGDLGGAVARVRALLGTGPTETAGRTTKVRTLAPYPALLALHRASGVDLVDLDRALLSAGAAHCVWLLILRLKLFLILFLIQCLILRLILIHCCR